MKKMLIFVFTMVSIACSFQLQANDESAKDQNETVNVSASEEPPIKGDCPQADEKSVNVGDASAGEALYKKNGCKNCHGPKAQGMASFPKLAGNSADYISMRLTQYRSGEKVGPNTPLMRPLAAKLTDEDITNIASYISVVGKKESEVADSAEGLPADKILQKQDGCLPIQDELTKVKDEPAEIQDASLGKELYKKNGCKNCHGPKAQGMASFPKLSGKSADYIDMRLKQYRSGEKVGPNTPLMRPLAVKLSDEDIGNIAYYISVLDK